MFEALRIYSEPQGPAVAIETKEDREHVVAIQVLCAIEGDPGPRWLFLTEHQLRTIINTGQKVVDKLANDAGASCGYEPDLNVWCGNRECRNHTIIDPSPAHRGFARKRASVANVTVPPPRKTGRGRPRKNETEERGAG